MKKLLFVALLSIVYSSFAQTINNPLKPFLIVPQSPESANLGRYGDIAVGEHTGTPQISVPLFTLTSGKLSLPLNLYYNSNGVKVAQEATWVGLGWQLSCVKAISYVAAGANDQLTKSAAYQLPWSQWKATIDYIAPLKINPTAGNEEGTSGWGGIDAVGCASAGPPSVNTPSQVIIAARAGRGQQDLFDVDGIDFSFKFYISPETGLPVILGDKNNCKVVIVNNNLNNGFIVTDGEGTAYSYTKFEDALNGTVINCWYLTEIRRIDGDYIKFKYTNYGSLNSIPPVSEVLSGGCSSAFGGNIRYVHTSASRIRNQYLTGMETQTEKISFYLSANRLDLAGDGARRLDSMAIESSFSKSRKVFGFDYEYFESSTVGGNYLDDDSYTRQYITPGLNLSADNLGKRLKLKRVFEKSPTGSRNKITSFEYNEDNLLPLKTSFAVDHWGNYNGRSNITTALNFNGSVHTFSPKLFSAFFYDDKGAGQVDYEDLFVGAIRGASEKYIKTASLKSIIYPTGGKTSFEFEPNTFNNYKILSAEEEEKVLSNEELYTIYDLNSNTDGTQSEFTIDEPTEVSFSGHMNNKSGAFNCAQMSGTIIQLIAVPSVSVRYTWKFDCKDMPANGVYNKVWDETILLPPSHYIFNCSLPSAIGFQGYSTLVGANLSFYTKVKTDSVLAHHKYAIGGGLRI